MADKGKPTGGPVSGRALARLLGLSSDNAVRSAVRSGRLRRCIVPGGFDPAIAVEEWRANTDPRQQRRTTEATDAAAAADAKRAAGKAKPPRPAKGARAPRAAAPPAAPEPEAEPAGTDDLKARLAAHRAARPAKAAPPPGAPDPAGDDGRTMADIRRDMLLVEEQAQLLDLAAKLGSVMPSEPLRVGVQTLAREMRDAILRLPDQYGAQIAADLNVERHACHVVLDRYCRFLFETSIVTIDAMKVFGDGEADDADDPA